MFQNVIQKASMEFEKETAIYEFVKEIPNNKNGRVFFYNLTIKWLRFLLYFEQLPTYFLLEISYII